MGKDIHISKVTICDAKGRNDTSEVRDMEGRMDRLRDKIFTEAIGGDPPHHNTEGYSGRVQS